MTFKVGVIRDARCLEHKPGLVHPEAPSRLRSVYRMLDKDFENRLIQIEPKLATLEQLQLAHTSSYIDLIMSTAERDFTPLSSDTFVSAKSYLAAWLAAGAGISAVDALMAEEVRCCFSLVRPPGHHALADRAGGFCIFNNLGVAAKYAIEKYGLERILIIDWDIHHGNALQELFYEDPKVLYFSTHYMGWYPNTGEWEETGEGQGAGYTVNIPVPKELKDDDIICVYQNALNPIVRKFKPQFIMVAAGFDAHERDPLGRTRLTENAYRSMTQIVLQLSEIGGGVPLLLSLEGGYDSRALANSIKEVLAMLAFQGRRERMTVTMTERAEDMLQKLRRVHRKHRVWI
ncbi:MAG: histone deacetylase family protein [Desulfomonilaceae bacterium]